MKTFALILALTLFSFLPSFGQKVIGYSLIAKGSNEYKYYPLPESKPIQSNKDGVVLGIKTKESAVFDRVDPFMPIAVPPRDEYSKFPIKVFPKNFPSNMPIYGLGEKMPERGEKPKILQVPK